MKRIAPSILSADFSQLGDEIKAVEAAGADWIHVDVMDGHFVPNITIGPLIVEAVKRVTALPIDVHLMIENPDNYIPAFAEAGASYISVQLETCIHLNRTVHLIKDCGAHAGVVLNPSTPVWTRTARKQARSGHWVYRSRRSSRRRRRTAPLFCSVGKCL